MQWPGISSAYGLGYSEGRAKTIGLLERVTKESGVKVRNIIKLIRTSLQLRLFLALTGIVALSLSAILASHIYLVQDYFIQQAEANLRSSNYLLGRVLADPVFEKDLATLQTSLQEIQAKLPLCNLQFKDSAGNIVYKSGQLPPANFSVLKPDLDGGCFNTIIPVMRGDEFLGTARLGVRTDDIARARKSLILDSVFYALFWFVLFLLPFFIKIGRMIRPIDELSKAAHEFSTGNLEFPVPKPHPGEDALSRLTVGFHAMAQSLLRNRQAEASNQLALANEHRAKERLYQVESRLEQERYLRENLEVENKQIRRVLHDTEFAFNRLIPRQMLSLMGRESILDVKLGDQFERKLTVMTSDIRNFTALSESMSPQDNFDFLNSFLAHMEPIISSHDGIIDKFVGDSILALFTQEADNALNGAIEMLFNLDKYNAGRARAGFAPLQIGIGLNTGLVMVGTVGGKTRMDSTVIGDAVNITSRIEELTKTYFTPLLISQNTLYDLTRQDDYDLRFLDRIRVKGKRQPISIFEVFNNDASKLRESKRVCRSRFETAIALYHLRQVERAMELLHQCIKENPNDVPARIYLTRCEEYLKTGQHHSTGELNNHMVWRKEYQVNIDAVDRSHRHLFSKVNDLITAFLDDDHGRINQLLSFIEGHLVESKQEEEYLMAETEYPFIWHHQREHRRFLNDFVTLKEAWDNGTADQALLVFRIQLLMFDWFSGHITNSDRHASRHILNVKQESSLEVDELRLKEYLASAADQQEE